MKQFKQISVVALIAAATLSSCSNDEQFNLDNPNKIGVRSSIMSPTTRANQIAAITQFSVWAHDTDGGLFIQDQYATANSNFLGGTMFWPKKALNWTAVALGGDNGAIIETPDHSLTIRHIPATILANQEELLVAYSKTTADKVSGDVQLHFDHALSQIEVQAKNTNRYKVYIAGAKLANVFSTGVLTLPTIPTTPDNTVLPGNPWDTQSTPVDNAMVKYLSSQAPDAGILLTGENKKVMFSGTHNFMLVPQNRAAAVFETEGRDNDGAHISVLCHIASPSGESVIYPSDAIGEEHIVTIGGKKYSWVSVAVPFNWGQGKKYTYILDFSNGGGVVDPEVDPETPPVMGGKITISTVVDSWVNATDIPTEM